MQFNELWTATDIHDDRTTIELYRATPEGLVADKPFYQLTLLGGPFSGHPTVDVSRKHLENLYETLKRELYPAEFTNELVA